MHVVETEPLKRCPFCGGEAILSKNESPYSTRLAYQVFCPKCHATGKKVVDGSTGTGLNHTFITPEEAAGKAVQAWNRRKDRRTQAEQERKVFCNPLTADEAGSMMEAVKLYQWSTCWELMFCENMARLYGCIPPDSDNDSLLTFLCTLYHYGQVQGIRSERARRKGGQRA